MTGRSRGHQYGTIIVDLERREPIEVFAGRETTAVAAWMRAHPSIEIVARDRAGGYSEAVDIALPAAKQVSDRWHLLCNLRDNVERLLYRLGPQLPQAAQQVLHASAPSSHKVRKTQLSFVLRQSGWLRASFLLPASTQRAAGCGSARKRS